MTDLHVNVRTTLITVGAMIVAWYFDWFTAAFWYGGFFVIPAVCIQIQNHFLKGLWFSRAFWAAGPWLVYGFLGVARAAEISHEGMKNLAYGASYTLFLSTAIGVGIIVASQFARHSRENT